MPLPANSNPNPNSGFHITDLPSKVGNPLTHLFHTPGVQNIEKAFSRAGGGPNFVPAAGSKMGSEEDNAPRNEGSTGVGTALQRERLGEQRPETGPVRGAFNEVLQGSKQGR